jgi:SPX domain protein involved in polyphosphate accumulation
VSELQRLGDQALGSDAVTGVRREVKFVFPAADPEKIARVLEQNAEPVRFGESDVSSVSSIYFDDHRLSSCEESMAGVSRRVKLRVRWYDESMATRRLFFERKRREGSTIHKDRTAFDLAAPLDRIPYSKLVDQLDAQLDPVDGAWLARRQEPTMLVAYRRRHFRDRDSAIRITLDWDLRGYDQLGRLRPSRDTEVEADWRVIVEGKAVPGSEDALRALLAPLRPRLSRSSKYVHCCSRAGWPQIPEVHD